MHSLESVERMKRADYIAFLTNRRLTASAHSRLLFLMEEHNRERPQYPVVFRDAVPLMEAATASRVEEEPLINQIQQQGQQDSQQSVNRNLPAVSSILPIAQAYLRDYELGKLAIAPEEPSSDNVHNPFEASTTSVPKRTIETSPRLAKALPHTDAYLRDLHLGQLPIGPRVLGSNGTYTPPNPRKTSTEVEQPAARNTLQPLATASKKLQPSKERRKLTRLLSNMAAAHLEEIRQQVSSECFSPADLQCALANTVDYHEHLASDILTMFRGFLDMTISRGVAVTAKGGQLLIGNKYSNGEELRDEDQRLVDAVHHTWKKYTERCCELALAEAAWCSLKKGQHDEQGRAETVGEEVKIVDSGQLVAGDGVLRASNGRAALGPPATAMSAVEDVVDAIECVEFQLRSG